MGNVSRALSEGTGADQPPAFGVSAPEPPRDSVSIVRDDHGLLWRHRTNGWSPIGAHWFRRHEPWSYLVNNRGPLTAVGTARTSRAHGSDDS